MKLTKAEMKALAAAIVNGLVADVLSEFPTITKAVDRLNRKEWATALDDYTERIESILLDKFDSSD